MIRKFLSLSLVAFVVSATSFAVQSKPDCVTVEYIATGTPTYAKAISSIGKLVFADGKASIVFNDNTVKELGNVSGIQKISFGPNDETQETPTAIASTNVVTVHAFPNPASDVLRFTGKADNEAARLFSIEGKLIKQTTDNEMNVSDLAKGTYILMIDTQAIKIVKN